MPTILSQLTGKPLERPCDERWDEMVGDERVRHCVSCAREVYDISAMTPREAEIRLLNTHERAPCIRYARRADGSIAHAPEPRLASRPAARPSFAAAAALGVTISASPAFGKDKKAPDQCVAYVKQADVDKQHDERVAAGKRDDSLPGASAFAEKPQKPTSPPPDPEPMRLGGAPPPIQQQPQYGTLEMTSKVARDVTIVGIKLQAPLASYLLTPGDFVAEVRDPDGKTRNVKFKITRDKTTRVNLDKK